MDLPVADVVEIEQLPGPWPGKAASRFLTVSSQTGVKS
jgi:hypothetical protein